jgi:hypothetical protein
MIALIIFLWWLSGFVSMIIFMKVEHKYVTVGDLRGCFLWGLAGFLTCYFILDMKLRDTNFWDKKIF